MVHSLLENKIEIFIGIIMAMLWMGKVPVFAQETTIRTPIIEQIEFTGNTTFSNATLLNQLSFTMGTSFSRPLLLEGKYYISNFYSDNGYKYNQVTLDYFIDETTGEAKVSYHIKEGMKAYIGEITITGNTKTSDKVIRRTLVFKTGDLYRRRDIFLSQSRLLALNFFEEAKIEEVTPSEDTEIVNITIKVTEKKTGSVSFGPGYSTEEGIRGFARYRQSNLFGKGQQFSVGVKWSALGQALEQSREINIDLFDPHFFDTDFGVGIETYYRREDLDNYNLQRVGGDIFVKRDLFDHTQGTLKFRTESDKTFSIANSIDSSVIALEGQTNLITMWSLTMTMDTRNNFTYPSRGSFYSIDLGIASEAFGGDVNFGRLQMDGRWYIPLIEPHLVLALRASAGFEHQYGGTNEIPIYERLYEGGADSVRGYKERYLGPTDLDGYPAGGDAAFIYSAELRFPIYKSFTGVVFTDAGDVWQSLGQFNPANVEHTVGMGLRYQTPIGPIRFDYGIHIPQTDTGRFYISVGQTF